MKQSMIADDVNMTVFFLFNLGWGIEPQSKAWHLYL